jgi:SWI/SNF-related matrix-associated actin-dependent regulator 1 of chromatin subfamily A
MQRSIRNGLDDLDVLLCTYTIFERDSGKPDRKFLQKIPFSYLVLDEAHSIKNSTSKKHDNLRQLMSKHRLLLSGTPVQNDVKELLALLTFLTPKVFRSQDVETLLKGLEIDEKSGLRGTSKEIIPIRQIRLMMAPFVLRRMKSDVLNQLVKKETIVERLKMTYFQERVYNNIIQRHAEKKLKNTDDGNAAAIVQAVVQRDEDPSGSNGRQAKKARKGGLCKELMDLIGDAPKQTISAKNQSVDNADSSENTSSAVEVVDLNKPSGDVHISKSELGNMMKSISSTELNNLFTALRKAANHPLLLRVHYTDPRKLDLIAKISLAAGHFGDQCNYQRVYAEIEKMSDFELHRICLDYASALGHLQLQSNVLFDSPKIVFLKEKLPILIVRTP